MIETIIIIAVIGILAAIAIPSFGGMLDSVKLDQSISELRSTLSSAQRQAMRSGEPCLTGVRVRESDQEVLPPVSGFQAEILSSCLTPEDLPEGISFVSNIIAGEGSIALDTALESETSDSLSEPNFWEKAAAWACSKFGTFCPPDSNPATKVVDLAFGDRGHARFGVESNQSPPIDPSGKLVAFIRNQSDGKRKCVVISHRLGLTRIGRYSGSLDPVEMTQDGLCSTLEWNKQ